MKLVISDAHEGIKAATARVLSTTWQRCRVHFQRNALAHAGKSSRRVVSASIATAFAQPDHTAASARRRRQPARGRPDAGQAAELAALMDGGGVKRSIRGIDRSRNEEDILACMTFPGRGEPFRYSMELLHHHGDRRMDGRRTGRSRLFRNIRSNTDRSARGLRAMAALMADHRHGLRPGVRAGHADRARAISRYRPLRADR